MLRIRTDHFHLIRQLISFSVSIKLIPSIIILCIEIQRCWFPMICFMFSPSPAQEWAKYALAWTHIIGCTDVGIARVGHAFSHATCFRLKLGFCSNKSTDDAYPCPNRSFSVGMLNIGVGVFHMAPLNLMKIKMLWVDVHCTLYVSVVSIHSIESIHKAYLRTAPSTLNLTISQRWVKKTLWLLVSGYSLYTSCDGTTEY